MGEVRMHRASDRSGTVPNRLRASDSRATVAHGSQRGPHSAPQPPTHVGCAVSCTPEDPETPTPPGIERSGASRTRVAAAVMPRLSPGRRVQSGDEEVRSRARVRLRNGSGCSAGGPGGQRARGHHRQRHRDRAHVGDAQRDGQPRGAGDDLLLRVRDDVVVRVSDRDDRRRRGQRGPQGSGAGHVARVEHHVPLPPGRDQRFGHDARLRRLVQDAQAARAGRDHRVRDRRSPRPRRRWPERSTRRDRRPRTSFSTARAPLMATRRRPRARDPAPSAVAASAGARRARGEHDLPLPVGRHQRERNDQRPRRLVQDRPAPGRHHPRRPLRHDHLRPADEPERAGAAPAPIPPDRDPGERPKCRRAVG